jgi:diguanylate cyclase (GGDEF)-like protein/PAS domain S-box-containing protein
MISFKSEPGVLPPMQPPCVPADEGVRLAALRRLRILDTGTHDSFDRVTRLAAKALQVPIALISLVDENRQWFKSRVGLEATETGRDISFCGHAVFERRPLVIRDAAADPRFAANPLVTGPPYIRSYMGVPLYSLEGHALGTLCVIDRRPRPFAEADVAALCDHAAIAQELIHAQELATQSSEVLSFVTERDELYRELFDAAPVGIVHTDLQDRVLQINSRVTTLLGRTFEELRYTPLQDLTHPDDAERRARFTADIAAGKIEHYRLDQRLLHKDGRYVRLTCSVALKRTSAGEPATLVSSIDDCTALPGSSDDTGAADQPLRGAPTAEMQVLGETNAALRRQIAQALEASAGLRKAAAHLKAITDSVPARIGYWNRGLICEFANEAYRQWYGLAPERVIGMGMRQLLGEAQFRSTELSVDRVLAGHPQRIERHALSANGTASVADTRYIPDTDEWGAVRGFYVFAMDITPLRQAQRLLEIANEKLEQESTHDYLTGLFNRRYFSARSEEAAAQFRAGGPAYGLILLDLDNFKRINDGHGHDVGDEVLRALGRIVREQLRERGDVAARLGGEELAVLCFNALDEASLCAVAERLRDQISKEAVTSSRGNVRFTGSFGVALSHEADHDWKRIYARADAALYRAKAGGKNRVVFAEGPEDPAVARRDSLKVVPCD